jgi:hypothetical protein
MRGTTVRPVPRSIGYDLNEIRSRKAMHFVSSIKLYRDERLLGIDGPARCTATYPSNKCAVQAQAQAQAHRACTQYTRNTILGLESPTLVS